ncbi:MAG: CBS domain-containing protein [Chitinophagaceae bacterium]|nr:CBS domain-containing protein [Anaerolineae bacterium]
MFKEIKVKEWMTHPVISVPTDTSVSAAQNLMREMAIRHLPIIDHHRLIGILSLGDLREASPSDATALSIWELNYLWDQLTVEKIMTRKVITVQPDDLVTDVLQMMIEHKFGALPVVNKDKILVGILTETDIFRMVIGLSERVTSAL